MSLNATECTVASAVAEHRLVQRTCLEYINHGILLGCLAGLDLTGQELDRVGGSFGINGPTRHVVLQLEIDSAVG